MGKRPCKCSSLGEVASIGQCNIKSAWGSRHLDYSCWAKLVCLSYLTLKYPFSVWEMRSREEESCANVFLHSMDLDRCVSFSCTAKLFEEGFSCAANHFEEGFGCTATLFEEWFSCTATLFKEGFSCTATLFEEGFSCAATLFKEGFICTATHFEEGLTALAKNTVGTTRGYNPCTPGAHWVGSILKCP